MTTNNEHEQMTSITPSFSISEILDYLQKYYQLFGQLKALPGYCDQNLVLTTREGEKYIVKIANTAEAKIELAMQNEAMVHLTQKELPVPQVISNNKNQLITDLLTDDGKIFYLRVLTYLEGDFYSDIESETPDTTTELLTSLGYFIARTVKGLKDFEHIGAYRYLEWDLAYGYGICQSKKQQLVGDDEQAQLVDYFLALYHSQTLPILAKLPKSIIHNDANDMNLLVDNKHQTSAIIGLIDFGDMVFSHSINELAITAAYALMNQASPITALKSLVSAYHQITPLTEDELAVLYSLIALRLCVSVCNSAQAIKENPDNDYLLVSAKPAWHLLKQLRALQSYAVLCQLRLACGLDVDKGKSKEDIIDYRKKHLGKSLSLSYKQPLKIVRGQGAYLFDEQGTPYLDMVNNVCHVGHCHPKVVLAGQEQLAKLNTNTRYLHDNLVNYSEQLLATMPDELSVCMLVNSGSEANELAFRLAKCYSKAQGVNSEELLVVDGAYHGNTSACIEASPYKFDGPGGEGAKPYVHKVSLPDPYRGEHQGSDKQAADNYAKSVTQVIGKLENQGKKPCAFICESLQGVAGQIIMPDGYLTNVYQQVRAAGGVCIADEVQVGFGRVGTHMWAFETQNVVPDIVTLGKPIGNGHPMAAVITTQTIADAFVTGMEYFNTFGGNPVSCAVGSAVLEVIKEDKLQENALKIGGYFQAQLKDLQQEHDLIGDVRGLGLFIGVELVEDRVSKEPATQKTAQLVEFLKENHILLSTEGPYYNVLKIKPPLVFSKNDVDKFIALFKLWLTS